PTRLRLGHRHHAVLLPVLRSVAPFARGGLPATARSKRRDPAARRPPACHAAVAHPEQMPSWLSELSPTRSKTLYIASLLRSSCIVRRFTIWNQRHDRFHRRWN